VGILFFSDVVAFIIKTLVLLFLLVLVSSPPCSSRSA
jgi:hypothetical protein